MVVAPEILVIRGRDPRLLAAALLLALGALVLLLQAGGGAPQEAIPGIPDPGALTGWGLPVLRFAGDALAVAVVAGLLVTPLTMARPADELRGASFRAVRTVGVLALAWCAVALALVVLTYSDQFAVPFGDVRWSELRAFATDAPQTRSLLVQAALAAVVAITSRWVLTGRAVIALLVVALVALVPPMLTGHAASSGNHDTAILGMVVHVLAAVTWVGGVAALWWHLALATTLRERAARRFSALAVWCLGLTAVSGVVGAWVRIGGLSGVTSGYGAGVLLKAALLVLLGLLGLQVRRRVLAGGEMDARRLLGLTGAEIVLMAVAMALGAALARTPPPVGDPYTTLAESILGGPIPPAPTLGRLLWSFTPSGLGFIVVGIGGVAYLVGMRTLRRRGDTWPLWRAGFFLAGLAVVGYATFGGLGTYADVMFSAHMAAHMALSMVAPILIVTGRPVQLGLRALPGSDVPGGAGPRQLLAAALVSRPARWLFHPVTAGLLLVGSLYVVYLSGVFDALMRSHLGHVAMEVHFLLAGLLFFELLLGDRPGAPVPYLARLLLLLVTMPFHAFFSITVMGSSTVVGAEYYRLLSVPYVPDLLADQELAGSMNWALGEIPMVLAIVILLIQWWRDDEREARRRDRAADRDGDAELAAYNRMLSGIGAEVAPRPVDPATPPAAEREDSAGPGSP